MQMNHERLEGGPFISFLFLFSGDEKKMKGNKANGNKAVLAKIMAISVLTSALTLVLVLPVFAANENVFVGITSGTSISGAAPDDTATVPIIVYNVTGFAAGTLRVTYDSSLCNVTDVTVGDLSTVTKNINTPGLARISAFEIEAGHTGDVTFANLKIKATGSPGETSPLNITVETLGTYAGQGIPAANIRVSNGTFTILSRPTPTPSPSPTEPPARGSGDASYITPTPTSTPASTFTPILTPPSTPSTTPTLTPSPSLTPSPGPSPTTTPIQKHWIPGFEAIFAIAGLLTVAYLVLRRKK